MLKRSNHVIFLCYTQPLRSRPAPSAQLLWLTVLSCWPAADRLKTAAQKLSPDGANHAKGEAKGGGSSSSEWVSEWVKVAVNSIDPWYLPYTLQTGGAKRRIVCARDRRNEWAGYLKRIWNVSTNVEDGQSGGWE